MNRKWWKAAGIRAAKTAAQSAAAMLSVGAVATGVDWLQMVSVAVVAAVYSLLTSVAGLPEVGENE